MMTRAPLLVILLLLLATPAARLPAQPLAGDLSSPNDGPLNFHVRAVPDLWHDAVVGAHLQGSAFTVMLQDKRTGRVPYELKVEGTVGSDVTIREHYDGLKLHAVAWAPAAR
ncbi:MAG: hypothetical protein WDN28_18375 [Chthoniobacter sp.]